MHAKISLLKKALECVTLKCGAFCEGSFVGHQKQGGEEPAHWWSL